jgi:hypothetical protein
VHPDLFLNLASLLCVVFFSTAATEMIGSILPAVFVKKFNLLPSQIGLIEGWSFFVAFSSKIVASMLSDKVKKRKIFIVIGTTLSIISKGCFVIATGFISLFIVKIFDRIAKGFRSSPFDALIADIVPRKSRGFLYCLKYSFFTGGAICGGYAAHLILKATENKIHFTFLCSLIPSLIALILSIKYIKDPVNNENWPKYNKDLLQHKGKFNLDSFFWKFSAILFLLMFAKFSPSFLLVKAVNLGIPIEKLPILTVIYDTCSFGSTLLAGLLSLKIKKISIFKIAIIFQVIAHITAYFANIGGSLIFCCILFGIHIGMERGTRLSIISCFSTENNRALIFSIDYVIMAFGLLFSNILAGKLNTWFGSSSFSFLGGILFSLFSLLLLQIITKKFPSSAKVFE